MRLWKLTDQAKRTYGGCQWGENITHTASGEGPLCTSGWLHAYTDPVLAVMLNPIHANLTDPILWESEGDVGLSDTGLKVGCKRLTTLRQVPMPRVTAKHHARFGILCALEVCEEAAFVQWAHDWLSGKDQSAWAAARAAEAAAWAAWEAAQAVAQRSPSSDPPRAPIDLIALAHQAMEGEDHD